VDHLFYIAGGVLVAWALLISFLGVVREDFPASAGAERAVGVISVLLVMAAIGGAIADAVGEEPENHDEGEQAALVLPF
jgi:fructose-specific phosphotransferase system IIC component